MHLACPPEPQAPTGRGKRGTTVGDGFLPDWPLADLDDDVMPSVVALMAAGAPFALVTIVAAGGGPRPVGSHMAVSAERAWGFISGGCVEADVALQARAALLERRPRRVTYGRGSPFVDIRLPCGGRIDLLIEPIPPEDPAMAALADAVAVRRAVLYLSDGVARRCVPAGASVEGAWVANRVQDPAQRLVVLGHDPYALAIASAGCHQGRCCIMKEPCSTSGLSRTGLRALIRKERTHRAPRTTIPSIVQHL